jgi:hypothetical protein
MTTTIREGTRVRYYDWPGYPGSYYEGRVAFLEDCKDGHRYAHVRFDRRVSEGAERPRPPRGLARIDHAELTPGPFPEGK